MTASLDSLLDFVKTVPKVQILYVFLGYFILKFFLASPRQADNVPNVGQGIFAWSSLATLLSQKRMMLEGMARYPNGVFRLPVYPFGVATVLTSQKLLAELRNAPEEDLSMDLSFRIFLQFKYTLFRDDTEGSHFYDVIRSHLTNGLNNLFPNIIDEIESAFGDNLKTKGNEWTAMPALTLMRDVAVRVANRSIIGLPLCRDKEYLEMLNDFSVAVPQRAFMINLFPSFMHPLVGPLISKANSYRRQTSRFVEPIINERRRKFAESGPDYVGNPKDYVAGIMETAPEGFEQTNEAIAMRILQINFGSILSTFTTLTHALYHIAAQPEYTKILREEIEPIIKEEGWTKIAMQRMTKFDSFLRESARINPLGMTTMQRTAVRDYVFSDGTSIKKGSTVAAAMHAVHQNPNVYENPEVFDPWRFLDEKSGETVTPYTTTSADFLGFGFGKHACPGRFFVTPVLKAVLSYLIVNYDMKTEQEGVRPANEHVAQYIIPNTTAKVFFKRRH